MLVVINKIHWCVAVCAINCTADHRNCWSHCSSRRSDSQIFVENRDFCLPHLHSTPPLGGGSRSEYCHDVWYGETSMVWLPNSGKFLKICLFMNVIDRQTLHDGTGCTYAQHHLAKTESMMQHSLYSKSLWISSQCNWCKKYGMLT